VVGNWTERRGVSVGGTWGVWTWIWRKPSATDADHVTWCERLREGGSDDGRVVWWAFA
jgi:hypothetical protein